MEKPVFVINGFLDSGKTSFIRDTLNDPQFLASGKVLLILCEEGEEEYDEVELAGKGVSIIAVEEQEQLTAEFLAGLEEFYKPNMIMIEWNGVWKLLDLMDLDMPANWAVTQIITMVDSTTFPMYINNMRAMILDEVRYSDVVIVNRCDDSTDRSAIRRNIKAVNRKAMISYERADGKEAGEFEEELPYDMSKDHLEIPDEDYGIWFMDASENPQNYEGKTIHFLSMLYVSPKLPKGYIVPGRMVMTCCAEDTQFSGFLAKLPAAVDPDSLRSRMWFDITAEIRVQRMREYRGKGVVLYITKMIPVQAPADPLIYFS
ncbi:MAG: GTPase [Lachnospiraceae bacterium]|nr:GTPase [Lachnospiraceae bacterium]